MINEENLNKLYEEIIKKQNLTTKELKEYGFNSKDLSNLVENGTLERIKKGYYSLQFVDELYEYGMKLISKKEYDKATACFKKCYEINPKHRQSCLQLFLRCIKAKNYEKAFIYFESIYDTKDKYYNAINNYYLFLLSIITELPEQHKQFAKFIKLEDIEIPSNDTPIQNKIRLSSINQRFLLALKQFHNFTSQNNEMSVQDIIIKVLLNQALEEQMKWKDQIRNLIKNKNYEELIRLLENTQERHQLTRADEYVLLLTKRIVKIIKTGKIPEKHVFSTDKLFDAIDGNNYKLALTLSTKFCEDNNVNYNSNIIHLLILEIQNLINEKEKSSQLVNTEHQAEPESMIEQQKEKTKETEIQAIINSSSNSYTFADITKYLLNNDLDNAMIALKNYLKNIEKQQYEFLIVDLIKISLIERDIAFTKPMIALNNIVKENFEFNISEYIQNFYENLAQNRFDIARIYLDIISKSTNLGQICILTEGLEQVLDHSEKLFNDKQKNKVELRTKTEDIVKQQEENIEYTEQLSIINQTENQPLSEEKETSKRDINITTDQEKKKDYDEKELINQKLELLYKKGIVLLAPMDSEKRKKIHEIVKTISDITSFSIESNNLKQIVLKLNRNANQLINIKELTETGNYAYENEDYDTCIDSYRQILEIKAPKAFVYAKLGLAYMKKYDKKTAINYLIVATELSKNEDRKYDFTELIAKLNGLIPQENKKPSVVMSLQEFKNDIHNYYGIEQVEQITKLVSSGITLEKACLNVGLNEDQTSIVTLIFAKICYAKENYTMGDQYMKKVEKTKNKSKFTKSLYEEIKRNKRFYKNRVEENPNSLKRTN